MSSIHSTHTKPEMQLKAAMKGLYMRYQPKMYGRPDFANKTRKIAIFVDGCFWHKCPICYKEPKSNTDYWIPKLDSNVSRDKKINTQLKKHGWMVYRYWEHEIRSSPHEVAQKIYKMLRSRK